MKRGLCHRQPRLAAVFFSDNLQDLKTARKICSECPVSRECLEYALETKQDHGTWAGTSARERYRLGRQRRLPS
jgi:WhiB family redox-sensing transcriptional regulator